MKSLFVLCIAFFALSGNQLFGQVKFSIKAQPSTTVALNQQFQLDVSIENGQPSKYSHPGIGDFQLLADPSESSFNLNMNGRITSTRIISYVLLPKQEGTFKIGKATALINGVSITTNELTITVTQAVNQQRQPPPQQQAPQQQPQETSQADMAAKLKNDIFFRLETSKATAYEGEMITATYRIYCKPGIPAELTDVGKAPAFEGVWSQEVALDPKRKTTTVTLGGTQYEVYDLFKYNLYPQRVGNLKIPASEIGIVVQLVTRQPRTVYDLVFNGQGVVQVPLSLKTEQGLISVKSLPEKDKPSDFTGAVGKFNFETSVSSKEGKTDDPITYTVKISGTGNLKLIESPALKLPPAFEVYDPKTKENITNGAGGLTGSKQYDYLVIPRQPGDYKIDSRSFSYFDPISAKYVTINSPEYALKITGAPSKNLNTGTTASVSKQDVSVLGQDIRYIKTATPAFNKTDSPFFGSMGFVGMYSAPFLLFLGLIALRRRNDTMAADVVGTKRRRAIKLAKKRLSVADKHLKTDDKKAFYDEVSRATWGYLGDKLNIDMAGLSKDNVEEKLQARAVKPETVAKLKALINTCELALYAPVSDEHTEMEKNYDTAMNLIADLEDEIKA